MPGFHHWRATPTNSLHQQLYTGNFPRPRAQDAADASDPDHRNHALRTLAGASTLSAALYNEDEALLQSSPPPPPPPSPSPSPSPQYWPASSTHAPAPRTGCFSNFTPHAPIETNPPMRNDYWTADLNPQMHQRGLLLNPIGHPNVHFHSRRGQLQMLAKNMNSTNDPYLRQM